MRLRLKIEFRRTAPTADFLIVFRADSGGHRAVRDIWNNQQKLALRGIKLGNALV
jgi:hypothetical protein